MIYERINNQIVEIEESVLHSLFDSLEYGHTVSIDTETTGIDPYIESILLVSFKLHERVFVIDWTKYQFDFEYYSKKYDLIWLAHNAKFDGRMFQTHGLDLEYWYCTMNCDQKIYQGIDFIKYGLNDLKLRYLNIFPEIDKSIRNDFIGRDVNTFEPTKHELLYACDDVDYLEQIMNCQITNLKESNPALLEFILTDGMGAMRANIDIELEGYDFNVEKWRENIRNNENIKNEIQADIEKHLKDEYPTIDMGSFDPTRKKNIENYLKQIDKVEARVNTYEEKITLLDHEGKTHQAQYKNSLESLIKANSKLEEYKLKLVESENSGLLNFKSSVQIRDLFDAIKVNPLPLKKDKSTGKEGVSIDKNVLKEWLAENPDNKHSYLMNLLSKYSKISHAITSFGENYINFINPVTNRMHTIYRDEGSETGRYTCGDKKFNYPNFQQVPADDTYRNCFYKKNHHFCIVDWSGAELTIMISLANDWTLKKIADDTRDENGDPDLHSYFATICWRGIYKHRLDKELAKKTPDQSVIDELTELCNLTVAKDNQFKSLRTPFKGITFGSIYGMHDGKCAKTLGITKEEAKIVLALMRETIPITFKMVEDNSISAFVNGYVLFSEKSGTKRWFESVVRENIKGTKNIEQVIKKRKFMEAIDIASAARNCSIQGLQSDMLKRALRLLRERIKVLNLPCKIVGHVHDEIHVVYPDYMSTVGKKWNKKTEEWEATYDCPYIGNLVKNTMKEAANYYLNTDIIEMDSASELFNTLKK